MKIDGAKNRKWLKYLIRYGSRLLLFLIAVLILIPVILALPPVKRQILKEADRRISVLLQGDFSLENYRYVYPIGLALNQVEFTDEFSNVHIPSLTVKVRKFSRKKNRVRSSIKISSAEIFLSANTISKLSRKDKKNSKNKEPVNWKIIADLNLEDSDFTWSGLDSIQVFSGGAHTIRINNAKIELQQRKIEWGRVDVDGACASVIAGNTKKLKDNDRKTGWTIQGKKVSLSNSYFDLQIEPDKLFLSSDINSVGIKNTAINLEEKNIRIRGLDINGVHHINMIYDDTLSNMHDKSKRSEAFDWDIKLKSGDFEDINIINSIIGAGHVDTAFNPEYLVVKDFCAQIAQAGISANQVLLSAKDFSVEINKRLKIENTKLDMESDRSELISKIEATINNSAIVCELIAKTGFFEFLSAKSIPETQVRLTINEMIPSAYHYFLPANMLLPSLNDSISLDFRATIENNWAEISECVLQVNNLGEISIEAEADKINQSDSMIFKFVNRIHIKPVYFKPFLNDLSAGEKFLPDEFITIEGDVIGNKRSLHTAQRIHSEFVDIPVEASYYTSDSSFQFTFDHIKLWADSLFSIPVKIHSGNFYAEGDYKNKLKFRTKTYLHDLTVTDKQINTISVISEFESDTLRGLLSINDSLLQADLGIAIVPDSNLTVSASGDVNFTVDSLNEKINKFSISSMLDFRFENAYNFSKASFNISDIQTSINSTNGNIERISMELEESNNATTFNLKSDILNNKLIFYSSFDSLLGWIQNGFGYNQKHDTSSLFDFLSALPDFRYNAQITAHPLLDDLILKGQTEFTEIDVQLISGNTGNKMASIAISNPEMENFNAELISIEGNLVADLIELNADINGLIRKNFASENFRMTGQISEQLIKGKLKGISSDDEVKFFASIEIEKDSLLKFVRIPADTLVIAGKSWSINRNNLISFSSDSIYEGNFILTQGEKRVELSSNENCPLRIDLANLAIESVVVPLGLDSEISGMLNSTWCFPSSDFTDIRSSIEIQDLIVDGETVGKYEIRSQYSSSDLKKFTLSGNMLHNSTEKLSYMGVIENNEWKKSRFNLQLNEVAIGILEILARNYINEIEGNITGNLIFDGNSESFLEGELGFSNTMINPKGINNRLHFEDNNIEFSNRSIAFDKFPITDDQGRKMMIDGRLSFEKLRNPSMQLVVKTDSMQIVNISDKKINPIFGRIMASNILRISGPVRSPDVNLDLRLIKGTNFTFRITENLNAYEGEGVVNFVGPDGQTFDQSETSILYDSRKGGVDFDARIVIDPETRFNLEYDENMEFDISLTGNGNITYQNRRSKQESMVGTYTVRDGAAVLKLQGLAPKNFSISRGSYLRWDGVIDNPIVNIEAIHSVKGSYKNPASGMSNTIIVDYDVMFAFKNRLNNPEIVFDLETDDQYMTTVLNAMPEEERLKQAINVLLLGFIVTPETQASAGRIISDHINQFWAQQLNSAADKSFQGVEVSLDIQNITNYSAGNAQDQTNLSYEVKKDIWNDRATVKVGGYVRTYTSSPQDASSRLIGDFSLEYKLNDRENLYGKLFSENKYEGILEGEIQRTGVGILYRQNYQSMSEIWEKRKQKKNKKSQD